MLLPLVPGWCWKGGKPPSDPSVLWSWSLQFRTNGKGLLEFLLLWHKNLNRHIVFRCFLIFIPVFLAVFSIWTPWWSRSGWWWISTLRWRFWKRVARLTASCAVKNTPSWTAWTSLAANSSTSSRTDSLTQWKSCCRRSSQCFSSSVWILVTGLYAFDIKICLCSFPYF